MAPSPPRKARSDRPDHAAESPQQIGSMISPPPLVAFSLLPVVSAFDELGSWLWCGVDGKQEGGEREGMDGLCIHGGFTKLVRSNQSGPVPVWTSTKPAQIQNSNLNSKK